MFYYEELSWGYYIWTDKIKWKYWPFYWIYVKNKVFGKFLDKIEFKKYPWYKYSIWIWDKKVFIIWLEWIDEVINL